MRLRATVVTAAAVLVAAVPLAGEASSSCIGPMVDARPGGVEPGRTFLLTGKYFFDGCNDTRLCVAGRPCTPPPPPGPVRDIHVTMRFYERMWHLGTIESARANGTFAEWFTMPDDAPGGQLMHVYAETFRPARIVALKPDVPQRLRPRIGDRRDQIRKRLDRRQRPARRRMDERRDGAPVAAVVALVGALSALSCAIVVKFREQR